MSKRFSFLSQELHQLLSKICLRADEVPVKGMKNDYSIAKPILMQKKDFRMVNDDFKEEYLQSFE